MDPCKVKLAQLVTKAVELSNDGKYVPCPHGWSFQATWAVDSNLPPDGETE